MDIIDLANPRAVIENSPEGSANLVDSSIPLYPEPGSSLFNSTPVDVAVTRNVGRGYAILQEQGVIVSKQGIIVPIDLIAKRQIDVDDQIAGINSIHLPNGSEPISIVIGAEDRYAYIADRGLGQIYVLDIQPGSSTYHQIIETINVDAPLGLRQLAISNDGRRLYASAPNRSQGKIIVINTDFNDNPHGAIDLHNWHKQIAAITTNSAKVEGISATIDPGKIVFTQRDTEPYGYGILQVTNDSSDNFHAEINKYAELNLTFQKFEINDSRRVAISPDGSLGFVLGYEGYQVNRGFNLISENPFSPGTQGHTFGTSIGIIADPLGSNPQLSRWA